MARIRYFTEIPAQWIDYLLAKAPCIKTSEGFDEKIAHLAARGMGVTVLPAALWMDLAWFSTKYSITKICSLVIPFKNVREQFNESSKRSIADSISCIKGLFGVPLALKYPNFVSNQFLPKIDDGKIHPYGGLYESLGSETIVVPQSIDEILAIVHGAIENNQCISVVGAGFSQGKQTLPGCKDSIIVKMEKINHIEIDVENKIATVGAGVTWKDLQNAADSKKMAVKVMQASNVFSIGGSLSVNCHGWDHKEGSLGNTVLEINIVNSQGEIETLNPEDELFQYVIGGYGLFGIILEVKLQLTKNYRLFDTGEKVDIKNYATYFYDTIYDHSEMSLFRLSLDPKNLLKSGYVEKYIKESPKEEQSHHLIDEPREGTTTNRVFLQWLRQSTTGRKVYNYKVERDLKNVKIASRNEIMRPDIYAMTENNSVVQTEWLQEYFVPGEELDSFINFLSNILTKNEVILLNASVRFVKKDSIAKLAYAKEGDRFAIVLCFTQYLTQKEINKTREWIRRVVEYLGERNGSFYLPYMHFATKEQFQKCYPQWQEIVEKKNSYDPNTLFANGILNDYFYENPKSHFISKKTHLEFYNERTKIQKFLNNVFQQVDTEKFLKLYGEILNQEESGEEIYRQLLKWSSEVKGSFINKIRWPLRALKNERGTLAENIAKIISPNDPNGTHVEFGLPGRMIRSYTNIVDVKGEIVVVNDQKSIIQSGWPYPYHKFLSINDYRPLPFKPGSIGSFTCYIGLHHCPLDKLDAFVDSIYTSLMEGGIFLLRDHDSHDGLASHVHLLFNANTGISPQEEEAEVRNMQPLQTWIDYLKQKGFTLVSDAYVRDGDSSENKLIKFIKLPNENRDFLYVKACMNARPGYYRSKEQTYLTAIEWFNVEYAQNCARVMPFWDYPCTRDIKELWKLYFNSFHNATKVQKFSKIILSDYGVMNSFIVTMMTVECLGKEIFYKFLRPFAALGRVLPGRERENDPWQEPARVYYNWMEKYGEEIRVIPSYAQPFYPFIKDFWSNFALSWKRARETRNIFDLTFDRQTINNLITGLTMTTDLFLRIIVSAPVNWFYGGADAADARTIGVVVKSNHLNTEDLEVCIQSGEYFGINVPRYEKLEKFLINLSQNEGQILEIAGQSIIKIELKVDARENIELRFGSQKLFERICLEDASKKVVALTVPILNLHLLLKEEEERLHRIYDF